MIEGYTSGGVIQLDVTKGSVVKEATNLHHSPITSVCCVAGARGEGGGGGGFGGVLGEKHKGVVSDVVGGGGSVVSVDAVELVNKLVFSKNVLV